MGNNRRHKPRNMDEKQPKLNWLQRRATKKMIKLIQKKIKHYKQEKDEKTEKKQRTQLIKAITDLQEILNITKENGEPLLYLDMINLKTEELIEILEASINKAQEII